MYLQIDEIYATVKDVLLTAMKNALSQPIWTKSAALREPDLTLGVTAGGLGMVYGATGGPGLTHGVAVGGDVGGSVVQHGPTRQSTSLTSSAAGLADDKVEQKRMLMHELLTGYNQLPFHDV